MKILLFCFLIAFCASVNYSESVASKAIQLSTAIYNISKSDQKINKCPDCYAQFTPLKQIKGNNILALLGVDKSIKHIIVTFRGSDNIHNFITDVRMAMKSYGNQKQCKHCKLHKGFYKSYQRLAKQGLQQQIRQLWNQYPKFGILFTGHSLGGAIALLAAVKFVQYSQVKNVKLYTLGQPRVGNQKYADYCDKLVKNTFRIIHKKDIVPHKPSYVAFYRHSGYQIWYQNGMDEDYKGCKGDSNYCSNSLGNRNFDYSTSDHGSINYLQLYYNDQPNENVYQTFKKNPKGQQLDEQLIKDQNKLFSDKQYEKAQEQSEDL